MARLDPAIDQMMKSPDGELHLVTGFGIQLKTAAGTRAIVRQPLTTQQILGAVTEILPADLRNSYDLATIRRWLESFLFRFFEISQFKRSAIPNGPKVSGGGSLSPRGDWRAPSDGSAKVWLEELAAALEGEG